MGNNDPLKVDSYWGVALTSMVAKVLGFLSLIRLDMEFLEADLNQTDLKSGSCADATLLHR